MAGRSSPSCDFREAQSLSSVNLFEIRKQKNHYFAAKAIFDSKSCQGILVYKIQVIKNTLFS